MNTYTGDDRIELCVGERQCFGVGYLPLQVDAPCGGETPARLEQLRREVARHDVGTGLGSRDRSVPGSGRNVEHPLTGTDAACLNEASAQFGDHLGGNGGVVAQCPHCAMLCLEIDGARVGHRMLPRM
jgi:hypothetical protein